MKFLRWRTIHNFEGDPYLFRLTLFSCRWFGIFLHKILRSDSDRDLHDHPWSFVTLLLRGKYVEETPADSPPMYGPNGLMYTRPRVCKAGTIVKHKAEDCHCLSLPEIYGSAGQVYRYQPVWTLFMHGPRRRNWGFHTAQGWVDWETYVARNRNTDTAPMEE